ncbi:hypothetical protein SAMN05216267_1015132 [Actinacidiphila rubida]|uniref:Uncharacterized protein n=1 Tax=Actinacidiphila rubida TaxID=310780 RepID=A0A1H8LA22_9ACTN|nr:hypothetical protein [Actinacidiphila rubida]SEO02002.1 hypothetical protein SAMN05216267_1015132 [Actinacidiphila rubida]
MLSLRVLRGSRPAVLGRWALVAAAAAGTGLLLLSALGWALAHPGGSTSHAVVRLVWCVVPVVVTVQLASAVGRRQSADWPREGMSSVGLGRNGITVLAAATTALVCAVGSALGLLLFLLLRGDVTGGPWDGVGPGVLAAGRALPVAGAAVLLALVPAAAACAVVAGMRPGRPEDTHDAPGSLPWGVALVAVGLAVEVAAPKHSGVPLPSGLGVIAPAAIGGWIVTAAGLVLAGPGLVYLCGRLLAAFRPGAVRLLAGRILQHESRRIGRPLGLLCATAAAALSAYALQSGGGHTLGPVTVFAFTLIAVCVLATAAVGLAETGDDRPEARGALQEVAAAPSVLRAALAARAGALAAVLVPVAFLVAALSTVP